MKQENIHIYQWIYGLRYVPIIAPSRKNHLKSMSYIISILQGMIFFSVILSVAVAAVVNSGNWDVNS